MPRAHMHRTLQDAFGNVIVNALCFVYLHDTTTAVTDMYDAETSGNLIQTLVSTPSGVVEAWFDSKKTVDILITDNNGDAYVGENPNDIDSFVAYTVEVEVAPPPSTAGEVDIAQNFTGALTHNGNAVVDTTDSRLSNQRVPTDGSVTAAKIVGGGLPESSITNLTTDLSNKATNSLVVHLAGTETVTGNKTFSATPTFSVDPIWNGPAGAPVHLSGVETITGTKTFSAGPVQIAGEEFVEMATPSTPPTGKVWLFAQHNNSTGKTQLCALFPSGAIQIIASQP